VILYSEKKMVRRGAQNNSFIDQELQKAIRSLKIGQQKNRENKNNKREKS
jgi:hypothetical protein